MNDYPNDYAAGGPKKADFEMLKTYDPEFRDLLENHEKMNMADADEQLYSELVESVHIRLKGIEAVRKTGGDAGDDGRFRIHDAQLNELFLERRGHPSADGRDCRQLHGVWGVFPYAAGRAQKVF